MVKNEKKWKSDFHSLVFNLDNEVVRLDGYPYSLNPVTNEKLLYMCNENKIYASPDYYKDNHIMYHCVRKAVEGKNEYGKRYIDILIYNDALGTIGNYIYNRSIGHRNDVNEVEIHQILSGKVLELIEYNHCRYLGFFGKGEYFEIPAGAFHCTYVLEDSTIVVNIFGNAYWEDNYAVKPYCEDKNNVVVINDDGKCVLQTDEGLSILLDDELENINGIQYKLYSQLEEDALIITKKYGVKNTEDIFELFSRMTYKQEETA